MSIVLLTYSAYCETLSPSKPSGSGNLKPTDWRYKMTTINATLNPVVSAIQKNAPGIIKASALEGARVLRIADAIENKAPSWDEYSLWKASWDAVTAGKATADTLRKRWSRLMKECEVTIPKSDSPEAQQKAKAREEAKAKIEALKDDELADRAKALRTLGEAKTASKYEKALEKREEARKPETIVKNAIKSMIASLRNLEKDPEGLTMKEIEEACRKLKIWDHGVKV